MLWKKRRERRKIKMKRAEKKTYLEECRSKEREKEKERKKSKAIRGQVEGMAIRSYATPL